MLKRFFPILAGIALLSGTASAVVPLQMNVQGSLLNADGTAVDGTFTIAFALYNGPGVGATELWKETIASVPASKGVFDELLGAAATPLQASVFTGNTQLWLGIRVVAGPGVPVGGELELPRKPLTSVAYAYQSQHAVSAASADNLTCNGCVAVTELGFDVATQAELDSAMALPATSALDLQCSGCVSVAELGFDPATQAELDAAIAAEVSARNTAVNGVNTSLTNEINARTAADSTLTGNLAAEVTARTNADTALGSAITAEATARQNADTAEANARVAAIDGLTTLVNGQATSITNLQSAVTALQAEKTLSDLGCAAGEMAVSGGAGAWSCAPVPTSTNPGAACQGDNKALQWTGSAWKCVTVDSTGLSAGLAKGFEMKDGWGYVWDGIERQSGTWTQAKADCEAKGGRLPTATELWRVGASQFSQVGNSYETNLLWSLTPWHTNGATQQHTTVRLSDPNGDSAVSWDNDTVKYAYRCVWPNNTSTVYTGNNCYGPPGSECYPSIGEGKRFNFDKYDRPSITYAGATWECSFYGAHLPTSLAMAEHIMAALPNGSNQALWTADHTRYDLADVIYWSDATRASWNGTYSAYWSWATRNNNGRYRFRCQGVGYDVGPNVNATPADTITWGTKFTSGNTDLISHTKNLGAQKWEDAATDCFARGGHVPHSRDWMELIRDGLPGGVASTNLWSSDWSYQSYAQVVQWSGVDKEYTGYHSQYVTWSSTGATVAPYRCTWYPLDASYAGPANAKCNGGQFDCYKSDKNGLSAPTKVWADPVDRSPAIWSTAVKTCAAEGGHLAGARDMVELIRDGLPNGQSNWVWTSDSAGNTDTSPALAVLIKWGGGPTGTQTGWTTALGNTTWAYRSASTTYGYRCIWSNQLW